MITCFVCIFETGTHHFRNHTLLVTQRTREKKARDWSPFAIEWEDTKLCHELSCALLLLQSLCGTFHARRFFEKDQWLRAKQRRGRLCLVWMPAIIARELLTVSKISVYYVSLCSRERANFVSVDFLSESLGKSQVLLQRQFTLFRSEYRIDRVF